MYPSRTHLLQTLNQLKARPAINLSGTSEPTHLLDSSGIFFKSIYFFNDLADIRYRKYRSPQVHRNKFHPCPPWSIKAQRTCNAQVNSVSSEEIANFDAQKWHREVDALLAEIQSKDCLIYFIVEYCGIEPSIFELFEEPKEQLSLLVADFVWHFKNIKCIRRRVGSTSMKESSAGFSFWRTLAERMGDDGGTSRNAPYTKSRSSPVNYHQQSGRKLKSLLALWNPTASCYTCRGVQLPRIRPGTSSRIPSGQQTLCMWRHRHGGHAGLGNLQLMGQNLRP